MDLSKVGVVVLSAGKGTRLNCVDIPKVMLEIEGRPIVSYTVETLKMAGFSSEQICLVVGFQKEKIKNFFSEQVTYAEQTEQKGTAHAAYTGMRILPTSVQHVLVMGGDDSAFYSHSTLLNLIDKHISSQGVLTLLTAEVDKPDQLGRIIRKENGDVEIIEKEYLTEEQKMIKEISTGTFVFDRKWFESIFPSMPPMRKLGELGLPTALSMPREMNCKYSVTKLVNSSEWFGINTPEELEEARNRKSKI